MRRSARFVDPVAVLACLVAVPVVHALGPILHEPYTLDESWVALSARAHLGQLPWVTASTPLGWTLLLRLFPASGQAQRLLPLLFLAGSVVAAYAFARLLGWRDRSQAVLAGLTAAAAALLLPAQQLRHDLKQYTADAALAVAVFALVAWVEAGWSRRRAAVLLLSIGTGSLLSHTVFLTGGAALGGLALVALARRAWRQVVDIAVLGALTLVVFAGVYEVLDRPGRTGNLYTYWAGFFPSVRQLPGYLVLRLDRLAPVFGMAWPLYLALAVLGLAALFATGRPATAVALALLPPGLVVAGVGRLYPLLDLRTSHFCYVTLAVLGAVGVAWLAGLGGRLVGPRWRTWTAAVVALAAVAGYSAVNVDWLRYPVVNYSWLNEEGPTPPPTAPLENVRAEVRYVLAHRHTGDVVAVHAPDQYAFAYYWTADRPAFVRGGPSAIHWYVRYPAGTDIVIAGERDPGATRSALARAIALAGPGHRVWLIIGHASPADLGAWREAITALRAEVLATGPGSLSILGTRAP